MIKTIDVLNKLNKEEKEKYSDMIKQVNIPDFCKCVSQFSGINISKLNNDTIAEYLITWARNKYRFYKMLGNQLRLDQEFIYKNERINYSDEYNEIAKKFPIYALWLNAFKQHKSNSIGNLTYHNLKFVLKDFFPKFQYEKSSITHFFKSQLDAPDELVTEIGKIYENKKIEATHTLSINPVDIMLASENPYDWDSCYRLELGRTDSHADGCMAAVLDTSSLIAYVWSSEGEYNMYNAFKFKKIRYYRIRQWINISDNYEAIHFANAYPNRDGYEGTLNSQLRDMVETIVANYKKVENKWRIQISLDGRMEVEIHRKNRYGYSEFDEDFIWVNKELLGDKIENKEKETICIFPYDVEIKCACGCSGVIYPSGDTCDEDDAFDGETCYNGEGFCAENYYIYEEEEEPKWCDWCNGECEEGLNSCEFCKEEDCSIWRETHKFCKCADDWNKGALCNMADEVRTYINDDGNEICNPNEDDCSGCYYYKRWCKKQEEAKIMNEDKEEE